MSEITYPINPVLIVDDEQAALTGAELVLETDGILNTICCNDSRKVASLMDKIKCSVVLLDLSMPHISGETLLPLIKEKHADTPIIIVTGHNEIETAISCMKNGSFDYMVKPVHPSRLTSAVRRAIELTEIKNEYRIFKDRILSNKLDNYQAFENIVTQNQKMISLFQYIETIASTARSVFITGETGVGKELIAKAIHVVSGRQGPFVPVNVASLNDNIFSDTLFGHLRGAFTGADSARQGLVNKATGGTLFLDEIGDLEISSQLKLLRLLQENEYYPLGADGARLSEARIVVATNKTILELQGSKDFRKDLYFRLQNHHVRVPPLKERIDDLAILFDYFSKKSSIELNKKTPTYSQKIISFLSHYSFPGNVRELESMVFEAVSKHKYGLLSLGTFREYIEESAKINKNIVNNFNDAFLTDSINNKLMPNISEQPVIFGNKLPTLTDVQDLLIREAMTRTSGNQTEAAKMLGITRSGLNKAIKRKNIC